MKELFETVDMRHIIDLIKRHSLWVSYSTVQL